MEPYFFIYLHRLSLASPYPIVPNTGRFLHRSAVLSTKVDTFLFPHRAVSWPPIAPWNWHRCLTSWEFIETSFSLSLSFSLFFLLPLVSIFFIFSFLPFSNPPLIEAGGSISTRFQNSFISRSAITDDMDDAYRDPWKINPPFDLKIITVHGFIVSPRSISYIGNLTVVRRALTCVPVKPISKINSDSRNKSLRWPISIRVLQVQLHTFQPTNHPPSTKTGEFFHPGIRVPCRIELIVYSKLEIPLFRRFYFSPIFKPACPLTISIRWFDTSEKLVIVLGYDFILFYLFSPPFFFRLYALYIYIFFEIVQRKLQ